jgi:polygalacturonase
MLLKDISIFRKNHSLLHQILFLLLFLSPLLPAQEWDKVPLILSQIGIPAFPDRDFNVTDYGAAGDGQTNCTEAFSKAVEDCYSAGGGRVVVPEGVYLTGAIHLKSNVNLYVSRNAKILFSKNYKDYLPVVLTRFEGVECMNYSPFIYAYGEQNIAITGSGTLDGQAGNDNWWVWKGHQTFGWSEGLPDGNTDVLELYSMPELEIPPEERIFGEGHFLRTNFIQIYRCRGVLIDSLTILRSPMWVIHPVLSENVIVQNVHIESHGPNNDGCNPESSKNVLIRNCSFDTGDDCIAIKSGRNADGRRINVSSENIIIQACRMKDGHGGVVMGSETSGDIRNIYIEDCTMDSPNLERALRIKTNSLRGGIIENIYMRNCTIGEVSDAVIKINFYYGEGDTGAYTPIVRNIRISGVVSNKSHYALFLEGYERSPISGMRLENCRFNGVESENYLRYATDLQLNNVFINGVKQ